jgi:hypothetical protein
MSAKKPLTQKELLEALQEEWGQYIARFHRMTPTAQVAFLEKQGYARFHDLLAHICAWWEEALKIVTSILDNQELPKREYDIDAFNAQALKDFKGWTEDDLVAHFENLRESLLDLVADLPPAAFSHPRIATWLGSCVVEHAEEHKII